MKKQTTKSNSGALSRIIKATFTPGLLPALVLLFSIQASRAGSATWNLNPLDGSWNTATNWTPATVPNGFIDGIDATATFATSNITSVSLSDTTLVDGIVFNAGASAFTITTNPGFSLYMDGAGITNNSGITQHFVTGVDGAGNEGAIFFTKSATAGNLTAFTNNGALSDAIGGEIDFFDTSTAGNGSFTNNGGALGVFGGAVLFWDSSTAGNGDFTTNGGTVSGSFGGVTDFSDNSTAGNATFVTNGGPATFTQGGGEMNFQGSSTAGNGTFITNGGAVGGENGGVVQFDGNSTAGNATLIANGGLGGGAGAVIFFATDCWGGTARAEIFGNAKIDMSFHSAPGMTIGSIEGEGNIFLGANNLTVGSNNLSTTFSGVIQDGGVGGGTGGSLTKIGSGTLMLTNANTYTGGTTIEGGKLVVNNMSGSGTSSGAVQVNAGTLSGGGTIAGAVTVGTGSGARAVLAPGESTHKAGTLTIQSALTFNSDATYKFELKTERAIADKVIANGVTISGARVSFVSCGNSALPPGTVFTMIDNTAATAIAGTFSNLADGSTFTAGSNTFQVNYEGGTGNDLTLTVQ